MNDRDEGTVSGCLTVIMVIAVMAFIFVNLGIEHYERRIIKPHCQSLGYETIDTRQNPRNQRIYYCVTYGLEPRIEYVGTLRELAGQ